MKLFVIPFCFLCTIITSSNAQVKNENHQLSLITQSPDWTSNLKIISLGTWSEYVVQENPKEQILAFIGDEYQKPTGLTPPYTQFLYAKIDNKFMFLKFISIKKMGSHYIHTYESGSIKVILDFDGVKHTASGNGDGGLLKFYVNGNLNKTMKFWTGL